MIVYQFLDLTVSAGVILLLGVLLILVVLVVDRMGSLKQGPGPGG